MTDALSKVTHTQKAAAINPLKSSQPLGAALAFLGVNNAMPLFHGTQGCTSFALVLLGRHYKEVIPIQTTAMDEIATILGGADHLEEALLNLKKRANPALIGVCTTALVETRGEDIDGDLKLIAARRGDVLAGTEIVLAHTPDFAGSIEEGWAKATTAIIEGVVPKGEAGRVAPNRINILPGSHLTVADLEAIRDTIEAFGLEPTILPDISGSLDGKVNERWMPTTDGGTLIEDIRAMGRAVRTIAIGEQMRRPAEALFARTGVPFTLFPTLTGLTVVDRFVALLADLSGRPVPARVRRARAQAEDALLDGHFHFGGKRVAIAGEPDLVYAMAQFFTTLGAEVACAVASTASPILEAVPAAEVVVGDLDDFESRAAGCDLLVTHSHGRQASERLGIPLMHIGFPIFDRLGAQHRHTALYEGTRDLVFEVANIVQAHHVAPTPAALDPFRELGGNHVGRPQIAAH